ncbi:ribulokinase, partial [Arthrobacter sp. NPDC056727]
MDVTADGSENYVIGVDYGTLSGRAVVVRVRDGKELGSGVFDYPHAVVTEALPADVGGDGVTRLPGEWALQVPGDYRDVLRHAVPAAIADAGIDPAAVVG